MRSDDSLQIHTEDEDSSILSAREAIKDIAFGSVAGMVCELLEFPFDLAKVRLQAQLLSPSSSGTMLFSGPTDCLKKTWAEEGFKGLYRGLPAPLVGSMAETAALFLAYTSFQNIIRSNWPNTVKDRSIPLSITQLGVASAGAGFVTSFVLTPVELIKCKMQVQMMNRPPSMNISPEQVSGRLKPPIFSIKSPSKTSPKPVPSSSSGHFRHSHSHPHSSMLDAIPNTRHIAQRAELIRPPGLISVIRSTVEANGVIGLWRGHTGTLLRETGGCAAWFVSKEWAAARLVAHRLHGSYTASVTNVERGTANLLPWESAAAGAIAGAVGCLALYPADTVKSVMQTEEELRSHRPGTGSKPLPMSSFGNTFLKMYRTHGFRGLYAGCGMTVARAVPSSAIIFFVYDGLTAWFG